MQIMKRVFPILTAAVVLFSLMVSPASAASALPDYAQDLLADCPDGFKLTDVTNGKSFHRNTAQSYVEGSRSYSFSWVPYYSMKLSRIVINVMSSGWPNSLTLSGDFGKQTATRIGAYQVDDAGNYISQWVVNNPYNFFSGLTVTADWSWNYSGSFNLVSVTGYVDYSGSITSYHYNSRACFLDSSGTSVSTHFVTIRDVSRNSLGFVDSYVYDTFEDSDGQFSHAEFFIDISPSDRPVESIDTLFFRLTSFIKLDDVSLTLYDSASMEPISVLSPSYSISVNKSIFLVTVTGTELLLCDNFIEFDLLNYDLSDVILRFSFTCDPVWRSETGKGLKGFRIVIDDIGFIAPVSEPAWYVKVYQWISGKLDSLFGDSSGGALGQAGEEMKDQAADMNAAQSQLDSVARPEVNADDMLDGFLDFNTGGLSVLSVMTSNSYVTAMMTVVFTFALCGYIFFGKKG